MSALDAASLQILDPSRSGLDFGPGCVFFYFAFTLTNEYITFS